MHYIMVKQMYFTVKYRLEQTVKLGKDPDVRIAAIQKLAPKECSYRLDQTVKLDPDPRVCITAIIKLAELES